MRAAASYKPLTHIRSTSLRAIMRTAAAALAAVTLLLVGFGGRVTATVNAAGKPVLTPSRVKIAGHDIYFESPPRPSGLLIIMHKCGRSGSDHWPRSKSCLECEGLPQSLAKVKQALSRGYAVAAINSKDRSTGGGGRCFAWKNDAAAVAEAVRSLPKWVKLPPGAPVVLDGASSGGSLALRLPSIVAVSGVIGEVIAPPGLSDTLRQMREGRMRMPPALYIHMPRDTNMASKVKSNMDALKAANVAVAQIRVDRRSIGSAYFSDLSPIISPRLSAELKRKMRAMGLLDSKAFLKVEPSNVVWNAFRSLVSSPKALSQLLASLKPQQREQNAVLVGKHILECIHTAWGHHETIGEHTTAALEWLEVKGKRDISRLVQRHRPARLSSLTVNTSGPQWRPRS